MSSAMAEQRTIVEGAPHGTMSGYCAWRCRCAACTAARRAYDRRRRLRGINVRIDDATGLPVRAVMQRRVLAALGGGLRTTDELAARLGVSRDVVKRRLTELRGVGLVERTVFAGNDEAPLWYRVIPSGRTCAHPGCCTVLSRYNPDGYCCLHAPAHMTHREYLEAVT